MLFVLIALFVVVPLLELAIILEVGREIGVGPTIAVLVADSVLGGVLMRTQGRAAWRRLAEATRSGRPPAREVLDGALIIAGGALLLTPGFLTDVLGLALLLPPTRALIRRVLARRLMHRMVAGLTATAPRPVRRPGSRPATRNADVEGTYRENVNDQRRGDLP